MAARRVQLASGVHLSVHELGAGPPTLLLHAWGETHRSFDRVVSLLAEHLHVVAPDQRGVGDSDKPAHGYQLADAAADVAGLLDALELASVHLVGTSSGGYVAQQVAVDHPDRVEGLVLVGSPRSLAGGADPFSALLAAMSDPVTADDVRAVNGAIAFRRPVPDEFLVDQDEAALTIPRHVWRAQYRGLLDALPPLDTGSITAPTLVLWGEMDDVLPRGQVESLRADVPQAQLLVYEETGHLVLWEHPGRVAADIITFVQG